MTEAVRVRVGAPDSAPGLGRLRLRPQADRRHAGQDPHCKHMTLCSSLCAPQCVCAAAQDRKAETSQLMGMIHEEQLEAEAALAAIIPEEEQAQVCVRP